MIGPQIFQTSDSPRYINAFIAHLALYAFYATLCIVTRILLMRRNVLKRRNTQIAEDARVDSDAEKIEHLHAFADLSDRENPDFRYYY